MTQHILAKDQLQIVYNVANEFNNLSIKGRPQELDEQARLDYEKDDAKIQTLILEPLESKIKNMVGSETANIFDIVTDDGAKFYLIGFLHGWLSLKKIMRETADISDEDRLNFPLVKSVYISLMEYIIPIYREEQVRDGVLDIMQSEIDRMYEELAQVKKMY